MMLRFAVQSLFQAPIPLPHELDAIDDVHVSDKYKHFAEKYAAPIGFFFDNDVNCRSTSRGVRKELIDDSFISRDIARIAERYDAKIVELTIFRLLETEQRSDRGLTAPTEDGWVSELWHSDNFPPTDFKVIVYMTDVNDQQGPFEYKIPVEYVPSNSDLDWRDTRCAYEGTGKKVTGPKGTTVIFKNNIVHKGNYCRKGYRDAVMIGLRLPGRYGRANRSLQRFWTRGYNAISEVLPSHAR